MAMIAQGDQQDNDFISAFYKGKQEGMREVVEWIRRYSDIETHINMHHGDEWQAKLKEWGVDG